MKIVPSAGVRRNSEVGFWEIGEMIIQVRIPPCVVETGVEVHNINCWVSFGPAWLILISKAMCVTLVELCNSKVCIIITSCETALGCYRNRKQDTIFKKGPIMSDQARLSCGNCRDNVGMKSCCRVRTG